MADALGYDPDVELRPGWHLRCHPVVRRLTCRALLEDPELIAEFDGFIAACTPGMVLLDLGAHFGLFSLAALHFGGADARAVAVDPSATSVKMLRRMVRLNRMEHRVRVIRAAATAEEGEVELVDAGVFAAGFFVHPDAAHPASERTTATGVTVDGLCRRLGLRPTHLKIDVEGFEVEILRGAQETLRASPRPLVFIELHNAMVRGHGGDNAAAIRELQDAGYTLFQVDGSPASAGSLLQCDLVHVVAKPP